MLSEILIDNYFNYAKEMLLHFVKSTKDIYGEEFLVYNIHSLLHLPEDVEKFGSLNNVSAFPFENYHKKISENTQ